MEIIFTFILFIILLFIFQQITGIAFWGVQKKYSVGIYEGETPFDIKETNKFLNPIFTKFDVTDVEASFVADPFIIKNDKIYYLFMEVYSKRKNRKKGEICVASGKNLKDLQYDQVVLKEDYHLSFPNVFKIEESYYMLPESGQNRSLDLYKSYNFPYDWRKEKTLLEGFYFTDPDIFYHNNLWWIIFGDNKTNSMYIYYSNKFDGDYIKHGGSPFYKNNKVFYRNAGKVLFYKNKLYRFSQDCSNIYGEKVHYHEIIELSKKNFKENTINTLISPSGKGWNETQMHQIDYIEENSKWYGIVDGGSEKKENFYYVNKFLRKFF